MKTTYYLDRLDLILNRNHFVVYKKHILVFGFNFNESIDFFRKNWIMITLIDRLNSLKVKTTEVKKANELFNKIVKESLNLNL